MNEPEKLIPTHGGNPWLSIAHNGRSIRTKVIGNRLGITRGHPRKGNAGIDNGLKDLRLMLGGHGLTINARETRY